MRARALLAGAVLAGTLAASGLATAHQTYGTSASQAGFICGKSNYSGVANPTNASGVYLDVRSVAQGPYLWSVWVYQESNNHAGMQTKKDQVSILDETDIEVCTNSSDGLPGWGHGLSTPDTLIY
jgi:hypothetical protein